MTRRAKGLRQFVVARQQTQPEQVVAHQVWRLVALQRSQAKPTHLRRAAQQLESEVRVARPVWRFAARLCTPLYVVVNWFRPACTTR